MSETEEQRLFREARERYAFPLNYGLTEARIGADLASMDVQGIVQRRDFDSLMTEAIRFMRPPPTDEIIAQVQQDRNYALYQGRDLDTRVSGQWTTVQDEPRVEPQRTPTVREYLTSDENATVEPARPSQMSMREIITPNGRGFECVDAATAFSQIALQISNLSRVNNLSTESIQSSIRVDFHRALRERAARPGNQAFSLDTFYGMIPVRYYLPSQDDVSIHGVPYEISINDTTNYRWPIDMDGNSYPSRINRPDRRAIMSDWAPLSYEPLEENTTPTVPVDHGPITNIIESPEQKHLWENKMYTEYAKDVCTRAGIAWRDEFLADIQKMQTKIDVNKHIFGVLAQLPKDNNIPPELQKVLRSRHPATSIGNQIKILEDANAREERSISDYNVAIQNQLKKISANRSKMHELLGLNEEETFEKEMHKIIAAGLFVYDGIHTMQNTAAFYLKSVNEVVIRWQDRAKGVDMRVNFGRIRVLVQLEGYISVEFPELKQAHRFERYPHPHVKDSSVCWGNANETYVKFAREGKLNEALNALWLVLTNYNDGSPYMDLSQFWIKQNPTATADSPRKITRSGSAWIRDSYLCNLYGSSDITNWNCVVTESEDRYHDTSPDDRVECHCVEMWEMRIMPYNIVDTEAGYFIAGPRGGNPIKVDHDELEWL